MKKKIKSFHDEYARIKREELAERLRRAKLFDEWLNETFETQQQAAQHFGVAPSTVYSWRIGKCNVPARVWGEVK